MSSMTGETRVVVGGIDTHSQTHHVAVIDQLGREVGDREFPATVVGYAALAGWLRSFGELVRVGVEGTSSYGAGLTRYLRQVGVSVLEVNRVALRRLARRHQHLTTEIKDADAELHGLVTTAAPGITDLLGVGVEVVGQLLTTVGDNPQRMRSPGRVRASVWGGADPGQQRQDPPAPAEPRR